MQKKYNYWKAPKLGNKQPFVALIGNPNSGKTTIFNQLTGLSQKVSNYPGITVDRKLGHTAYNGHIFEVLDLPGTYSITAESIDERIVTEQLLYWIHNPDERPSALVSVVDASNLSRNLYLTSQIIELGIPVIIALNMMDRVIANNCKINIEALQKLIPAVDIVELTASQSLGIEDLKNAIHKVIIQDKQSTYVSTIDLPNEIEKNIELLKLLLEEIFDYTPHIARSMALRLITRNSTLDAYKHLNLCDGEMIKKIKNMITAARKKLDDDNQTSTTIEGMYRYMWIDNAQKEQLITKQENINYKSKSERLDEIITHPFFGPMIFVSILYFIFQSIFTWASVPMDFIDGSFNIIGDYLLNVLPYGMLRDLLVEGIVAGVGAILIFLPQIVILIFFLTILEDSGYMARVAFMTDRYMNGVGLHGRSVLPLMSGYACAIPGIMATRTIDSWRERIITILVLPLMSCSARLPVYGLMINTFVPSKTIFGIFNLQGLTLVFMYLLGTMTALIIAKISTFFIKSRGQSSFLMELPPYRIPFLRTLMSEVYLKGKAFILTAGQIIMAISIVLWILASFPKNEDNIVSIHESYAGRIGHTIEPIIEPLGFDWKIGIGLITSFAAREVMVSTLATIYNVEKEEGFVSLSDALKNDTHKDGRPVNSFLVALSLMVFYVYAAQCMATFAIVKTETNSWKWPIVMVVYMTALAYTGSFLVYQSGLALGYT